jgi:hypothetical protein
MRAPFPARLLLAALVCVAADAAALKASMDELDRIDPPEAGKAGMQAALQKVRTSLAALKTSAAGQWDGQVTEMDGAVAAFQTTVAGVDGDSLAGSLPAIVNDLERIDGAWTALEGRIEAACG